MSVVAVRPILLFLLLSIPLVLGLPAGPAAAAPVFGDLDGDGVVALPDETWLQALYGDAAGSPTWDPAADLHPDGTIDSRDLARFGAAFGDAGDPDTDPPSVFITLNDVPDDQNDLLVVPPEGFQITVGVDGGGGSLIDPSTLTITSDQDFGAFPPGAELASVFDVSPTRLFHEVAPGAGLAATSHYVTVEVADLAGNVGSATYGFAVRPFGFGAPLETLQEVFFDFDQDRSLGAEIDFLEDLREYGLSTTLDPALEADVRDRVVAGVVERAREIYGLEADGSPGPDPVNVAFSATLPAGPHARICIGGRSSLGGGYLGGAPLDPENLVPDEDTCTTPGLGVFPQAIDNRWDDEASYLEVFTPVDPDLGGTPVGENPLDAAILTPGFVAQSLAEFERFVAVHTAIDTFASVVGTVAAHETGHLLGLVAHGPAPGGLFGGSSSGETDHNVVAGGSATPSGNWVMNKGTSFSFDEIAGRNGTPPPVFRPLAQAYLRDRVALNQQVTGLYPAPTLASVTPNPAVYGAGEFTTAIQLDGAEFFGTPNVDLRISGGPTWQGAQGVVVVDPGTITASINVFVIVPGLYDVRVTNPDGQAAILPDHLEVQQQ